MKHGYTPNFKWSVADVDRVLARARAGKSAVDICATLSGSTLESTPDEIIELCHQARVYVPRSRLRAGR